MRRHAHDSPRSRGITRAASAFGLTAGVALVGLTAVGATGAPPAMRSLLPVSAAEAEPLSAVAEIGAPPGALSAVDRSQGTSRGQSRSPLVSDIASAGDANDLPAVRQSQAEAARLAGLAQDYAGRKAAAEAERVAAEQAAAAAEAERITAEQATIAETYGVAAGSNRALATSMLADFGWGASQFECLDVLWQRESNWNHLAENPSSGAYGIPQALPANKMATVATDWRTNPATQISWGLRYIDGTYGTPCSAWSFWQAHNWY